MAILASDKGGGDFQQPPIGTHVARCIQVIDLGTQRDQWQGKPKLTRKVRITWELPNEKAVFDETKGEEPFFVSKEYTLSLGDRANLRHDLEGWRGQEFTEDELKAFDLAKLLGRVCMLSVIHKTSASKKKYAAVTSVSRLPKGTVCPDQVNPSVEYSVEEGPNEVFKALPEWIREKITASEEVQNETKGGGSAPQGNAAPDDDEIPF